MEDFLTTVSQTRTQWWKSRRRRFNIGLIISIIVSYCSYLLMAFGNIPNFELQSNMWPFHLLLFLLYIGIFNGLYFFGAVLDKRVNTYNELNMRSQLYVAICMVACAIPLLLPIWFYIDLARA